MLILDANMFIIYQAVMIIEYANYNCANYKT